MKIIIERNKKGEMHLTIEQPEKHLKGTDVIKYLDETKACIKEMTEQSEYVDFYQIKNFNQK